MAHSRTFGPTCGQPDLLPSHGKLPQSPSQPCSTSLLPTQTSLALSLPSTLLGRYPAFVPGPRSLIHSPAKQQLPPDTVGKHLQVSRGQSVFGPAEGLGIVSGVGIGHAWCQLGSPGIHAHSGMKVPLSPQERSLCLISSFHGGAIA